MQSQKITIYVLVLFLILICCSSSTIKSETSNISINQDSNEQLFAESGNRFALKLFRHINQKSMQRNVIISPLSISTVLTMTMNGADGDTKEDMAETLEFDKISEQKLNGLFKGFQESTLINDEKVKFTIANSIWYRSGFNVELDFLEMNRKFFNAEVTGLNFNKPDATEKINSWVNKATNQKIQKIIEQINPSDVMVLINAIYFNGEWKKKFKPEQTQENSFWLSKSKETKIKMMFNSGKFPYFENEDIQMIELTYGQGEISMIVVLPGQNKSIDELISSLNQRQWEKWIQSMDLKNGRIGLPKFKTEYGKSLKEDLIDLGMKKAFSNQADFSRMSENDRLFISDVLHKTYINVNETGTEAAAATAVIMKLELLGRSLEWLWTAHFCSLSAM